MSPFILPEATADSAADLSLFILIKINNAAFAPRLRQGLKTLAIPLIVHIDTEKTQALLVAEPGVDADAVLGCIITLLEGINNTAANHFEIIESRLLVASAVNFGNDLALSRFIKVKIDASSAINNRRDQLLLTSENVFGTGLHPSTRLAVRAMDDLHEEGYLPATVIDIGCGSGILAILAARMGAKKVCGIDVSQEAVDIAKRNAVRNNLKGQCEFATTPAAAIAGHFDLVLANVTGAVMTQLFPDICRLAQGGKLIISGLQGRQGAEMAAKFGAAGFMMTEEYREGKWVGWKGEKRF